MSDETGSVSVDAPDVAATAASSDTTNDTAKDVTVYAKWMIDPGTKTDASSFACVAVERNSWLCQLSVQCVLVVHTDNSSQKSHRSS